MGKLYIVPTPIGNMGDITIRALDILKSADLVLVEDTRQFAKFLKHYNFKVRLSSYHSFNEHKQTEIIVQELKSNNGNYALVSDAGTPGISDPAYLLVKKCIDSNIDVECLPGATAFVPALVESGLPTSTFCFEGFLPHKKGRAKRLALLKDEIRTIIFYESPHRVLKTLSQLCDTFGAERKASVSRELTKIYAETKRGKLGDICNYYKNSTIKGEFVIIVHGKE